MATTTSRSSVSARRDLYAKGVLPLALAERAAERPDEVILTIIDGPSLTYAELNDLSLKWAAALSELGIGAGDCVATMMVPSAEAYAAWIGLGWLRAYDTAVNTEYRGATLAYILNNSQASVVIVHAQLLPRVLDVITAAPAVKHIVVTASEGPLPDAAVSTWSATELLATAGPIPRLDPPRPQDISSVTYTSGTTGPSKGVMFPWAQMYACAKGTVPFEDLRSTDVFYSTAPMHHGSGRLPLLLMVLCGGRLVVRDRFSGTRFWDEVRAHGCTIGAFIGAMSTFVWTQPERPDDADNPLRLAVMFPVIANHREFQQRFGLRIRTLYSMTEIGPVIGSDWEPADPTSCGVKQPGYELRIVDSEDYELADGEVGELVVRAEDPWVLFVGYLGMPEATVTSWRNGWFHTGDALRRDSAGNYYFIDRIKDAIRRRGENISSFEVEAHVNRHPDIVESAAIALPSEWGEDEVKIVVVRRPGSDLTPEALIRFLADQMPRFMVPRYVEFVDELPKTDATLRTRKVELRRAGVTPATWDREAAGITLSL